MVVIDTSVAYKWFERDQEEYVQQALSLLSEHTQAKETLAAPHLIIYELANAWATKTHLPGKQIEVFLSDFEKIGLQLENVTLDDIRKAVALARERHVSVYDASFAVLAKEKKSILFTADTKFVKQVNLPFVKHLSEYVDSRLYQADQEDRKNVENIHVEIKKVRKKLLPKSRK